MAIREYNPTTPGRRGMTTEDYSEITAKKPIKSLLRPQKQQAGRNNQGRITTRHRGGGVKRFYRVVSFSLPVGYEGTVEAIEYDPNRSARIARLKDTKNQYRYVIAGAKMKVGGTVKSGEESPIEPGNRLELKHIPEGTFIYNIELQPGKGGQMVRSAGTGAQLMAKEDKTVQVRLPSGEVRVINANCEATIGAVGNVQHQNIKIGTAGRKRRQGRRPQVRGKAMNAVDHPHGGGDGGAHGIGRDPKTPWGQKTLGYRTRRNRQSDKFIVRTRHDAKRR